MLIYIDVDDTLTVKPEKAKKLIDELRVKGHKIVIYTHRGDALIEETKKWLADYGIQYDGTVFNKPYFDLLIDNRVMRFEGDWDKIKEKVEDMK